MYLGDEETGTITFWVNTSFLRMSLARLANIANRFLALENAHCPERLGRVVGVQEMPTVVFEIVDAHGRIVVRSGPSGCGKGIFAPSAFSSMGVLRVVRPGIWAQLRGHYEGIGCCEF
jgi:hypothetical protein